MVKFAQPMRVRPRVFGEQKNVSGRVLPFSYRSKRALEIEKFIIVCKQIQYWILDQIIYENSKQWATSTFFYQLCKYFDSIKNYSRLILTHGYTINMCWTIFIKSINGQPMGYPTRCKRNFAKPRISGGFRNSFCTRYE